MNWTPEKEKAAQAWLDKQKAKDDLYDERMEFGFLLARHVATFSPEEWARYNELRSILEPSTPSRP